MNTKRDNVVPPSSNNPSVNALDELPQGCDCECLISIGDFYNFTNLGKNSLLNEGH